MAQGAINGKHSFPPLYFLPKSILIWEVEVVEIEEEVVAEVVEDTTT